MSGFIYQGKSTDTILSSSRLVLAAFSEVEEMIGHERETVGGDPTITRPVANEYGTKYENNEYEYALIKMNGEPFTDAEQVAVERWLTSPKKSAPLSLIDCEGNVLSIYHGKFISTNWTTCAGGYFGVTFVFQNQGAYPTKHFENTYTISGTQSITIDCESDELEEYVYPVLTIVSNNTNQITITNTTDNNNQMTVNPLRGLDITIDCDHCILSDGTTSGVIDFADIGWTEANIYWLRLLPGENTLTVTGNFTLAIAFDAPCKRVGDWL